jgi:hypothetical protein
MKLIDYNDFAIEQAMVIHAVCPSLDEAKKFLADHPKYPLTL